MDLTDGAKLALGALLVGTSALSGNALLGTVAGGIGVNWASEALEPLVASGAALLQPGAPLARVYQGALRQATDDLRRAYEQAFGPLPPDNAFALLAATAGSVGQAAFPADTGSIAEAQAVLGRGLDGLLHGHAERQVAFLKARLLAQTAREFQRRLATDDEAWRLFYGWLLQELAQQSAAIGAVVSDLPQVRRRLDDAAAAFTALQDSHKRLEQTLQALQPAWERIAAGGAGRSHTQTIGDAAQIGVAIAGDAHGPVTYQTGGVNFGSGNQITVHGDIVGGDSGQRGRPTRSEGTPAASAADLDHLRALLAAHTQRLQVLELQAARFGSYVPAHIVTEIDETRREVDRLRAQLGA